MKLSLGVAAALAGFTAAQQPADVYIIRPSSKDASAPTDIPSLGRSVAHLVMLQRLAPETGVGSLSDFPKDTVESTISYINDFGRASQPLFGQASTEPSQLLLMLEGVTEESAESLKKSLGDVDVAFQVADAPSSAANRAFASTELPAAGVAQTSCELDRAINPLEEECWGNSKSSVALYDVKKDPSIASALADNVSRLAQLAKSGEMETTILLLPDTSRTSKLASWSPNGAVLQRRGGQRAEAVMTEAGDEFADASPIAIAATSPDEEDQSASSANPGNGPFLVSANSSPVPACFASKDSCMSGTGNCSNHGECVEKYSSGSKRDDKSCFVCGCLSTASDSGSVTHWAGATCSKVDVSVPFWLFAGVTLALIGLVGFALRLLFDIGEEKLPGVIGAGVSKSK